VEVVESTGTGVLTVRCAVRGLKQGQYYLDSGGAQKITPDSKAPAGTLEVEAKDSVTGERIVALVDDINKEKMAGATRENVVQTVHDHFKERIEALKNLFLQEKVLSQIPK
jgi:hypothetical protein